MKQLLLTAKDKLEDESYPLIFIILSLCKGNAFSTYLGVYNYTILQLINNNFLIMLKEIDINHTIKKKKKTFKMIKYSVKVFHWKQIHPIIHTKAF